MSLAKYQVPMKTTFNGNVVINNEIKSHIRLKTGTTTTTITTSYTTTTATTTISTATAATATTTTITNNTTTNLPKHQAY